MLESLPEGDDWLSDASDEDDGWDLESRSAALNEGVEALHESRGKRVEVDSKVFHTVIAFAGEIWGPKPDDSGSIFQILWPKIAARKREEAKQVSPWALFQEIHSYIKGSYMALDRPSGMLSKEEYLKLPHKMAPNFKGLSTTETPDDLPGDRRGHRDLVYDLFTSYEEEKRKLDAYDISDLIHHIWTRLLVEGYKGPHIDSIFVDETQDFTQAELRLFIRICRDKNDMVRP